MERDQIIVKIKEAIEDFNKYADDLEKKDCVVKVNFRNAVLGDRLEVKVYREL